MFPRRGDVYWVALDPARGSEIQKTRPCLVVTNDIINERRRTVVVIPLSQTSPKKFPLYVSLASISEGSIAVIDQIRVVDKDRLGKKVATANSVDMENIAEALKIVLNLE